MRGRACIFQWTAHMDVMDVTCRVLAERRGLLCVERKGAGSRWSIAKGVGGGGSEWYIYLYIYARNAPWLLRGQHIRWHVLCDCCTNSCSNGVALIEVVNDGQDPLFAQVCFAFNVDFKAIFKAFANCKRKQFCLHIAISRCRRRRRRADQKWNSFTRIKRKERGWRENDGGVTMSKKYMKDGREI